MGKWVSTFIYISLIGAIGIGVITHAGQFSTAFSPVGSFFLNVMGKLEGR